MSDVRPNRDMQCMLLCGPCPSFSSPSSEDVLAVRASSQEETMSEATSSVTQWELDHVVDEITTLPPGHLAIIQVKTSIDRTRAHALLDQVPEAFKDRIMLLVGADEIYSVDEAVLLAARESVRQEHRSPGPRQIRDNPQA